MTVDAADSGGRPFQHGPWVPDDAAEPLQNTSRYRLMRDVLLGAIWPVGLPLLRAVVFANFLLWMSAAICYATPWRRVSPDPSRRPPVSPKASVQPQSEEA
jgi:hypothetical protein